MAKLLKGVLLAVSLFLIVAIYYSINARKSSVVSGDLSNPRSRQSPTGLDYSHNLGQSSRGLDSSDSHGQSPTVQEYSTSLGQSPVVQEYSHSLGQSPTGLDHSHSLGQSRTGLDHPHSFGGGTKKHRHKGSSASDRYLSPEQIAGVKKFVFFVGYARSGHSIIGALMDAHPHVVIAHEFFLFSKFRELDKVPEKSWKSNLFELLARKSVDDATTKRKSSRKGYNLVVENSWQGRWDRYIEVIGDKSGGLTTIHYKKDKDKVIQNYRKLKQSVSMPIRIIHAVRNPYDIISTKLNYQHSNASEYQSLKTAFNNNSSTAHKLEVTNEQMIKGIDWLFNLVETVVEMIEQVFGRENVLEVHNCDLVDDPRATVSRIFQFLEVDTSNEFLDTCAAKVFKSVSRSRDTVEWKPGFVKLVEMRMKKYEMFNRYSFTSD